MINEVDSDVTISIVQDCKSKFPNFTSCRFDKGFSSAVNQIQLEGILEEVILPKKGKLSNARKEIERSKDFVKLRHPHSAVESAINCLEHHGLDKCLDRGTDNFKLYVSISITGRNIQRIGSILRAKERASEERKKRKLLKAA